MSQHCVTAEEVMVIWGLMHHGERKTLWLEYCQDMDFDGTPAFEEFITFTDRIQLAVQRRVLRANGILR